jgi:very-short-patch-repair endonuclease
VAKGKIKSELEELLAIHLRENGISFEREYQFAKHIGRKWAADFKIEDFLLVEVQGGTMNRGKHGRGTGIEKDREKSAAAWRLGWMVLEFTSKQIKKPIPGSEDLNMDTEAIETIRAAIDYWGPNGKLRGEVPQRGQDDQEGDG